MAKQKTPVTLDPFTQWAHKSGRIFMIVFTVYMVVMPFIICTVYDCMPSFKMCLPGLISILVIMTPMSVAEIGSYTPILGSSSYLTFASGNLMNLKMPCIINAQKIANALIATAVSSSVTIVILALGMLLLSFIQPILENETFETASNYLLPALFGCMSLGLLGKGSGKTKVKNKLLPAIIPVILVSVLTIMGIATTGIAGILMIVMIPILILISWIMWKAGIVKVVPND